jgi:hypothetical protein
MHSHFCHCIFVWRGFALPMPATKAHSDVYGNALVQRFSNRQVGKEFFHDGQEILIVFRPFFAAS